MYVVMIVCVCRHDSDSASFLPANTFLHTGTGIPVVLDSSLHLQCDWNFGRHMLDWLLIPLYGPAWVDRPFRCWPAVAYRSGVCARLCE